MVTDREIYIGTSNWFVILFIFPKLTTINTKQTSVHLKGADTFWEDAQEETRTPSDVLLLLIDCGSFLSFFINRSGDYFVYTGGVGFTAMSDTMRTQLQQIFDRDWNSPLATFVNNTNINADYFPSPNRNASPDQISYPR